MSGLLILIYISFAILVGIFSKKTLLGFLGGFLLSLLITPLLMAIILQLFRVVKKLD
jgi:hypothetical protein